MTPLASRKEAASEVIRMLLRTFLGVVANNVFRSLFATQRPSSYNFTPCAASPLVEYVRQRVCVAISWTRSIWEPGEPIRLEPSAFLASPSYQPNLNDLEG